jgi:hypothetical protein
MNFKIFLFRLTAIVTAFLLGVGFFNAAQYVQSFFPAETATVQPVVKQEIVFAPEPVGMASVVINSKDVAKVEDTRPEFSAEGDYYIIGDLPKEFKDFDTLSITTTSYENASAENNYEAVAIPPEGFIATNKRFNFKRINIADKQIAFETETKKGVSYKFVGEFIDEEKIEYKTAEGYDFTEYAILKGRLTKIRDGKKIAETEVNFAAGGC